MEHVLSAAWLSSVFPPQWVRSAPRASSAGAATGVIWLAIGLAWLAGGLDGADRWAFDRLAALAPAPQASSDVAIVAIDPPSFQELGRPWPWPRAAHAALTDALADAGARAIVFDIVFDQPSADDDAFAEAISASPAPVVLAAERTLMHTPYAVIETRADPAPALAEAASAVGRADLPVDADGRLRRLPPGADALARAAARVLGATASEVGDYVRLRRGETPFRTASYYQALEPEAFLPPGWFDGAVVFIGLDLGASPVARAGRADQIIAPGGGRRSPLMAGVEAHAHVFETLRAGDGLRAAPRWLAPVLALLALGAGVFGATRLGARPAAAVSASAGVGLGAAALAAIMAIAGGSVLLPAAAVAGGLLTALAHGAQAFFIARAERGRLARGFERYVAPEVLARVLRDRAALKLGGERREVTVLVSDLQGFTGLMERIDAEAQAALLRDYLGGLAECVLRHQGAIDQFVGDSVIALFNAPTDQPDHVARALACAADIDRFGEAFRARASVGETRVGVETGEALVGNFGSERRFHYTAMGDVVNVASRLEGAAKRLGCRVLAGPVAAERAGETSLRPAARLTVPGRAEPLDVFTLDAAPSPSASQAYRKAYALLETAPEQAAEAFRAARAAWPEDPLAALHLRRLEAGAPALIALTEKAVD